jgi:hypothetical protein
MRSDHHSTPFVIALTSSRTCAASRGKELPDDFHRQNVIYRKDHQIPFASLNLFSLLHQSWNKFPLSLLFSLLFSFDLSKFVHTIYHMKRVFFSFFLYFSLHFPSAFLEQSIMRGRHRRWKAYRPVT